MTELTDVVGMWMRGQRWYATKSVEPQLRLLSSIEVPSTVETDARILIQIFCDDGPVETGGPPRVYHVPLVMRPRPDGDVAALIGAVDGLFLYDGPLEREYIIALIDLVWADAHTGVGLTVRGHSAADRPRVLSSRRLSAEQSNTSVVAELDGGGLSLVKVFRVLQNGENPDISTLAALTEAGSDRTPALLGWLDSSWPAPDVGLQSGQIALVQDFVSDAVDGWELALGAAGRSEGFVDRSFALGAGTAELHQLLARARPTRPATRADVEDALETMLRRLAITTAEFPQIAALRPAITAVYEAAASSALPPLQRIHGDLHLGQTLYSARRGWQFIDFEGEPLRPLAERTRPAAPTRDVAGMLRSFDYVAGSLARREPPVDAVTWAARARTAYREGYASVAGDALVIHRRLLEAFELDKAVYEIAYEVRHRPAWVPIPFAAVHRLLAAHLG